MIQSGLCRVLLGIHLPDMWSVGGQRVVLSFHVFFGMASWHSKQAATAWNWGLRMQKQKVVWLKQRKSKPLRKSWYNYFICIYMYIVCIIIQIHSSSTLVFKERRGQFPACNIQIHTIQAQVLLNMFGFLLIIVSPPNMPDMLQDDKEPANRVNLSRIQTQDVKLPRKALVTNK